MISETTALTAPIVKYVIDNQLKLSAIQGDVVAVQIIALHLPFIKESKVKLFTKMGNATDLVEETVTIVPSILELKVLKSFFEENLASASSATLHYTVTNPGEAEATSKETILTVVK